MRQGRCTSTSPLPMTIKRGQLSHHKLEEEKEKRKKKKGGSSTHMQEKMETPASRGYSQEEAREERDKEQCCLGDMIVVFVELIIDVFLWIRKNAGNRRFNSSHYSRRASRAGAKAQPS